MNFQEIQAQIEAACHDFQVLKHTYLTLRHPKNDPLLRQLWLLLGTRQTWPPSNLFCVNPFFYQISSVNSKLPAAQFHAAGALKKCCMIHFELSSANDWINGLMSFILNLK